MRETAVKAALAEPRSLDEALVEAQTARRVVDRLVGYLVSPLACVLVGSSVAPGAKALRKCGQERAVHRAFLIQPAKQEEDA